MKNLSHTSILELVTEFAPTVSQKGVCNGFTSMWLQAALTSKKDLAFFYERLDDIAQKLKNKTPAQLKTEIDNIYQSLANHSKPKPNLTEEDLKKTELRAFSEAVAMQQDPPSIFKDIHQTDKKILYPLTASKKIEAQQINLNTNYFPPLYLNLSELELYLEKMKTLLLTHAKNESIGFLIQSLEHATGVYLDAESGKFHFIDINQLENKPSYHSEVDSKELASLIFKSFGREEKDHCPISVIAVHKGEQIAVINELENHTIKTEQSFFKVPENPVKIKNMLTEACLQGNIQAVTSLLMEPDIENILNSYCPIKDKTPLFIACEYGHTEIVKLLLATKNKKMINSIEIPNDENYSALSIAKEYDYDEIVTLLKSVLPPPSKWPRAVQFSFNLANNQLETDNLDKLSLKRKAEEGDLDKRPAKKANNTEEMELETRTFSSP